MSEASVDDAVIMKQLYRAHAAVFVCAYVGLLGYFAVTDPSNPVAVLFSARSAATEQPQSPAFAAQPDVGRNIVAATPAAAGENVSVAPPVSSAAVADDSARQKEYVRLKEVRVQATSAEQPQQRAQAIDQLNAATPETLQALQAVVTSDSAVRNRIRALNSLRVLADREEAKDSVISIVHLAMVDSNASVAARASEVYRELTQEQTPVE